MKQTILILLFSLGAFTINAQPGYISTVIGCGGYNGDSIPATNATLFTPGSLAIDTAGNLYISDVNNGRIRKVDKATRMISSVCSGLFYQAGICFDPKNNLYLAYKTYNSIVRIDITTGNQVTVAGNGISIYAGDGGPATAASIFNPSSVAVDRTGNIYLNDASNRIRKVDGNTGIITTIAGNGTSGFSGDGGPATAAGLSAGNVALDTAGNVYFVDILNDRVREINVTTGIISTVAGNGTGGYTGDGGPATAAGIAPLCIAFDASNNMYITLVSQLTCKVDAKTTAITRIAGSGYLNYAGDGGPATNAAYDGGSGIAVDKSGNYYITDENNFRVRKVSVPSNIITTVAGIGNGDGGPANSAVLAYPSAITIDNSGNIYLADHGTRIRKVDGSGNISTAAGNNSPCFYWANIPATKVDIDDPWGVATDAFGNFYCTMLHAGVLKTIIATDTTILFAGNGTYGYSGDGGPATAAQLNMPTGIAFDTAYNMYVIDQGNNNVRKIDKYGKISTIAGKGSAGFSGDGGPATAAELNMPWGIALDRSGNVFVADYGNLRIRRVDASTGIISTIGGTGSSNAYIADGTPATAAQLNGSQGIAVDNSGNVYITNYTNVLEIKSSNGLVYNIAGTWTSGSAGDGGPATAAQLMQPSGLCFDAFGNLYVTDYAGARVRKINSVVTGINPISQVSNDICIYPNPASEKVYVRLNSSIGTSICKLVDLLGQNVWNAKIPANTSLFEISLDNLSPGVYFLNIIQADNTSIVKKLEVLR